MFDPVAGPELPEDVETPVQILGASPCIFVLAELGELGLDSPEPGTEDDSAASEDVQRRDRVSKHVWAAAGDRRDRRPDHQARGRAGHGGERHPGIGC